MNEQKKQYSVNWKVRSNKDIYSPNTEKSTLTLTDEQAKPLLACGAVSLLDENSSSNKRSEEVKLSDEQKLVEIVKAINLLDLEDEANVIGSGAPDTKALSDKLGFAVSAALRDQAWQTFQASQEDA